MLSSSHGYNVIIIFLYKQESLSLVIFFGYYKYT